MLISKFMKAGIGAVGGLVQVDACPVLVAADDGRELLDWVSGGAVGISHDVAPELDAVPTAPLVVVPA